MHMLPFKTLSISEIKKIDRASVDILEKVGVRIESKRAVSLLVEGGAIQDKEKNLVKIPEWLTRKALSTVPSHIHLYDRNLKHYFTIGGGRMAAAPGHNGVRFIDHRTGKKRPATCKDCADISKLSDMLEEFEAVAVPVMPQDVNPKSAILHGFNNTVSFTTKHIYFSPDTADAVESIIQISRVVSGEQDLSNHPPITCQLSPTSPLLWDREAADGVIKCAETGIPLSILPQPFSGMTAPVTIAGLLTQHNAELLSGVVISQLVRPGTPVIWGSAWTTFEMKKSNILICSPEASALRVAGAQMALYYKMPSHTIGPDADAHGYDQQLGWEKLLSTLAGLGGRVDLMVNAGLFDSAWTVSLEQVVVDAEIISICRRFLQGVPVNDVTMALDVIAQVGPGGHFMENPHTLNQLREGALWEASISNTFTSRYWEEKGQPSVMDNAARRVDQLLASWEPKSLEKDVRKEIDRIIKKYENEHV